jgi:hypothetical protein
VALVRAPAPALIRRFTTRDKGHSLVKQERKRWFLGGERLPPLAALTFALVSALVAAGWILLAWEDGFAVWKRWVLAGTAAVFLLHAAYYAMLFRHRRRNSRS